MLRERLIFQGFPLSNPKITRGSAPCKTRLCKGLLRWLRNSKWSHSGFTDRWHSTHPFPVCSLCNHFKGLQHCSKSYCCSLSQWRLRWGFSFRNLTIAVVQSAVASDSMVTMVESSCDTPSAACSWFFRVKIIFSSVFCYFLLGMSGVFFQPSFLVRIQKKIILVLAHMRRAPGTPI